MKELSLEEKAKAYDKALEKARQLCAYPTSKPFISDLQDLFPELSESEDEKIRKALINQFSDYKRRGENHGFGYSNDKILAWLEKQGEQKSAEWSDEDEIMLNRIGGWLDTLCDYLRDSSPDCIYDVHKSYSWLKSIKRRVQPKQEWSHNDNIILETIEHEIERIPAEDFIDFAKDRCLEWLRHRVKYLNPHNAWKPSEEQMEIIDMVLSNEAMDDNVARVLRELKEELKKL